MQSCRCMNVIATLAYLWITCVISMPTPNTDTEFIQKTSRSSKFDAFSDNVVCNTLIIMRITSFLQTSPFRVKYSIELFICKNSTLKYILFIKIDT